MIRDLRKCGKRIKRTKSKGRIRIDCNEGLCDWVLIKEERSTLTNVQGDSLGIILVLVIPTLSPFQNSLILVCRINEIRCLFIS